MNCLLLLLGAPLQDRRADERVAEEVGPQRCPGPGELLVQHDLLAAGSGPCRRTRSASWRRSSPRRTAWPSTRSLNALRSSGVIEKPGVPQPCGQVVLEPAGDLGPEVLGFRRVGQVHGGTVPASPGRRRPGGGRCPCEAGYDAADW